MAFEWRDAKAELNWQTHGVSFELATTIFRAPFAIEFLDDREDYGEERFASIGMAEGEVLLFVGLYRTRRPHWHHFSPEGNET
ncbi:MAG: BrnT family toxin [Acidobacteriota bacterium]|nr:BrnT family toxin [Acidobacteriota bacterium]